MHAHFLHQFALAGDANRMRSMAQNNLELMRTLDDSWNAQ